MIFAKFWSTFQAQLNKLANTMWKADPIAQMQYEYDSAVEQMGDGRVGLEQYRVLVERVGRQVAGNRSQAANLEARIKAYLQQNDRAAAARYALELQKLKKEMAENETQLRLHEQAYTNNLAKIKHASGKLAQLRDKIKKYDAELKMSRAEAELAKLCQEFKFDVTTDFGRVEQEIQDQISHNRARARVAADLSSEGLEDVERDQQLEQTLEEQALREFETQEAPEVIPVAEPVRQLPRP